MGEPDADKRPLTPDPQRPFGVVLSGGGARGAFQVGVWEVLRHHPSGLGGAPAVISGTSAGAINGALIAAGLTPEQMLEFWLGLADDPPVVANSELFRSIERGLARLLLREPLRGAGRRRRSVRILAGLLRRHKLYRHTGLLALALQYVLTARFDNVSDFLDGIATSHVFSTAPFRHRLIRAIGGPAIRESDVRLAINTVDVRTGHVVRFVNHPPAKHTETDDTRYHYHPSITVDMILASASIPLLFNPVVIDDIELWDGGVLVNTPLAPTVALGARRIIPVLVNAGRDNSRHDPMHLGTGIERLADAFLENAYNADRKLLLTRNELATRLPELGLAVVELYRPIRPESSRTFNAGSYLFFERSAMTRMYDAGRAAAHHWLASGPRLDRHARG